MIKIIFLDFDGVLNHQAFYIKRHGEGKSNENHPYSEFCPEAVENLNSLIEQTGAKLVISSTWRHGKTVEYLEELLKKVGFKGVVVGKTPVMRNASVFRGNEIHKWMSENKELIGKEVHEYRNYVILDDDSDMLYWQRNNFILVDRFVGLTKGVVFQAAKILNQ
jgi:HAD domain in Swiss Army Knife RNA repair proteins